MRQTEAEGERQARTITAATRTAPRRERSAALRGARAATTGLLLTPRRCVETAGAVLMWMLMLRTMGMGG